MSNISIPSPHYSLKCALSSFLSNYLVSILHPLELLKTRQQSTSPLNKAMMEKQPTTSSHNTKISLLASEISTPTKDSKDYLKVFILQLLLLHSLTLSFFGCIPVYI
jgi:hypothetical protein